MNEENPEIAFEDDDGRFITHGYWLDITDTELIVLEKVLYCNYKEISLSEDNKRALEILEKNGHIFKHTVESAYKVTIKGRLTYELQKAMTKVLCQFPAEYVLNELAKLELSRDFTIKKKLYYSN